MEMHPANAVRNAWAATIEYVFFGGRAVGVTRRSATPHVVLVPPNWYEQACAAVNDWPLVTWPVSESLTSNDAKNSISAVISMARGGSRATGITYHGTLRAVAVPLGWYRQAADAIGAPGGAEPAQ
ncbi:hypothetical protein [Kitasatospora sp. NPDC088783]|uniref:hypothetical protein n=1 Tax=Kitasatospora sp. NPDC088783 TaxID=3364077 RepID=UPI003807F7FB